MIKRLFASMLALMMLFVPFNNIAYAADADGDVVPAYTYTRNCCSTLSISGTTGTCTSELSGVPGQTTKIAIYQMLQKKTSSGSWNSVASWQETDIGSEGYASHTKGSLSSGTYRVYTIFTVYAGSNYETIHKYSISKTV